MKYKFLGQPDKDFPTLVHGKIYELNIYANYINSENQIAVDIVGTRLSCEYETAIHFYEEWELVRPGYHSGGF